MLSTILSLALGCSAAPPAQPRPLPDVVLILVDTLRADAPHYAGNPLETSPHIDAFAAESAQFSRAYAASTWTLPSTASILTGLLPCAHGVVHDTVDHDHFGRLGDEHTTVAEALRAAGYRTAAFINNAFLAPEFGLSQGFDRYDYDGAGLVDHRSAAATVERALSWLSQSDQPAFLLVHVMEPHADYQPAPAYAGRFTAGLPHTLEVPLGDQRVTDMIEHRYVPGDDDKAYIRAAYHEEVLTVDAAVGTLLDGLRARPGWPEARVVFTSDHGEEFWEHGSYEHGHITNGVVTRVPLIIKAPGVVAHRNDSVVSAVDLFELLVSGGGTLGRLARSGRSERGRVAVSGDTLYSQSQVSAVTDDLRMVANLEARKIWAHTVAPDGSESARPIGEPDRGRLRELEAALLAQRGNLDVCPAADPATISGPDTFDMLRELGYIDETTPR